MTKFENLIEELESLIEHLNAYEPVGDTDRSGRISLIYERLAGVQSAVDDWRQG